MNTPTKRLQFRSVPFEPARLPFFYGWIVMGIGTLGMVMSAPGQTVGVSVFTDPLIEAHGLSRSLLSLAYLVGTLSSALILSYAGRLYDRHGARIVATIAASGLALTLVYLSFSVDIAEAVGGVLGFVPPAIVAFAVMALGFFMLRFTGQGVLTLASRNMVMEWFEARRGMANAFMGIAVAFGFSYAPRVFETFVSATSWDVAWRLIGVGIAVFAVIAIVMYRDTPEAHGLKPDGGDVRLKREPHPESRPARSFTAAQARKTYSFWIFTLSLFVGSIVGTAYTFHIVSIFADAGMSRAQAVGIFFPASMVAISVQFLGSWLSDRMKLRYLCTVQLLGILTLLSGLMILRQGTPVIMLIAGQGLMQGMFGITSNITWPRFFGRKHLGAITGMVQAMTVAGSAVGPYLYSFGRDLTGSYFVASAVFAVFAVLLLVSSFWAERPEHPEPEEPAETPPEHRTET
jgi:MFS transporter, OFA family, oxalate/formate antiporter